MKRYYNLLSYTLAILLATGMYASSVSDLRDESYAQLVDADRQVAAAMERLQNAYLVNKFSLTNSSVCYDTDACSDLTNASVSSLITADTTLQSASLIASITTGFIPLTDTTSSVCTSDINGNAPLNSAGFSPCLASSANYPGYLAVEVRFKNSSQAVNISGALDGKKVLFLAKGPGINAGFIQYSSTILPTIDRIGSFVCINTDGTAGDGINNGGRLGMIGLQTGNQMLVTYLPYQSTLGGLGLCLK